MFAFAITLNPRRQRDTAGTPSSVNLSLLVYFLRERVLCLWMPLHGSTLYFSDPALPGQGGQPKLGFGFSLLES